MVLAAVGGRYRVHCEGETMEASLRGRLKLAARTRILVGDEVTVHLHDQETATIEAVHPRRSLLKRRTPGRSHGIRAVAANVDQVMVVGAVGRPDWDPALMDRFTVVAEANDLPVVVVVNKCDLAPVGERLAGPHRTAGYPVVLTSVPERRGLEELRSRLVGRVSLFTGPSGVGKSSLLNVLQPGLRLRTAAVSARSRAGRHTTVAAEMHAFRDGGFVVDTPGLRDIALWGIQPHEVAAAFPELACHAPQCRFDNCRHLEEPGCGVVAAVIHGEMAESRLESYRRMLREADEATRPWA